MRQRQRKPPVLRLELLRQPARALALRAYELKRVVLKALLPIAPCGAVGGFDAALAARARLERRRRRSARRPRSRSRGACVLRMAWFTSLVSSHSWFIRVVCNRIIRELVFK